MSDVPPPEDLISLREHRVVEALQRLFECERRGLCLLKEWIRRYGEPGSGCNCFRHFHERVTRD